LLLSLAGHVVAVLCKDRIKAKDLTGIIEVGCCHNETINIGWPLVLRRLDSLEQFQTGSSKRRVTVGKQYVTGCVTCKERLTDEHRRLSANIIPKSVQRLRKDFVGKNHVVLCVGDNLRYRIGFLVPEILDVNLSLARN
jgi:hypothetical protein